jgi:hypothetical protein
MLLVMHARLISLLRASLHLSDAAPITKMLRSRELPYSIACIDQL